jgi:hypothetical protein
MFHHLSMPGAFDLLDAFAKVPDAEVRRAVIRLIKTLAKSGRSADEVGKTSARGRRAP